MSDSIPVKLTADLAVEGATPVILIGPNGSGKTRLGVKMVGLNRADMVPALRNIALPPELTLRSFTAATQEFRNLVNRQRHSPWEMSNEIQWLFSKLMIEDSDSAVRFRDTSSSGKTAPIETTKLMRLRLSWARLFPGRQISFEGHKPTVVSDYSADGPRYEAQKMSDGERVALYLAGRVLDTDSKVIIIDEPEVHFHSKLAVRFWSEMETLQPDVRFVCITHDLPFALSRGDAHFVIVMPGKDPQIVKLSEHLPPEVVETILAAASFSIYATRIIFCEGEEYKSLDWDVYSAWFNDKKTVVMPVGSSRDVVQCTKTFSRSEIVSGVSAVGIIDRDYWPDEVLNTQRSDAVSLLPYHEIECLLCHETLFKAVATHLGKNTCDIAILYDTFVSRAKAKFIGGLLNKQISERFRRRCEMEVDAVLNGLKLDDSVAELRKQHLDALDPSGWIVPAEAIFDQERQRVEQALSGSFEECLALLPGKKFLRVAAQVLGMSQDAYVGLICSAMSSDDDNFQVLKEQVEGCLSGFLPPRKVAAT